VEPRYYWTRRTGKRMKTIPFPQLLHAFFHDWLVQQRNVSHHTVLSYRDSWRLFLRFVAARKVTSVSRLGLSDLSEMQVLAFLNDIEQVRKSSIGTRNCRLAALHSFFSFVADREPLAAAQCAAVLRIPNKKMSKPEVSGLDEDEITAILAQPNRSKAEANATMSCWRSSTTQEPVFRRRWIYLLSLFDGNRRSRFDCSEKVAKKDTARFGPRRSHCSRLF
jgi:integrase